jgi:anti-anti-sigma factor
MEMDVDDLEDGVTRIRLRGDLDIKGANAIDLRFSAVASAHRKVLVDMGEVGFLASIGIRTLLAAAKAVDRRGGRLVLLDPSEAVEKVLETCGASQVLPIRHGLSDGLAAVSAL